MNILQNKFARSLPKAILFAVVLYNFAWCYWQTLDSFAGSGIASPWYSTKDFPLPQFLLAVATYLLLIRNRWVYALSCLLSGYCAVTWIWLIANWFLLGETVYEKLSILWRSFSENPLTAFESQILLAITIFGFSVYTLIKDLIAKPIKTLS